MKRRAALFLVTLLTIVTSAAGEGVRPEDLVETVRLSDPQVTPLGTAVAFGLRETDLKKDRRNYDIWLSDLTPGSTPRRLTMPETNEIAPQWSPDGKSIYHISDRSGSSQVWKLALDGTSPVQVTDYPVPVSNLVLSPDGRRIAFTAKVFSDCEGFSCTATRLAARGRPSGMVYDKLLVRHWDTWKDGRRSVLYTAKLNEDGKTAGEPVAVSTRLEGDVPSMPFGGRDEIAFSPDGNTLYFVSQQAVSPLSTNLDIFAGSADGSAAPVNLTAGNPATDTRPIVSPDGKRLAWLAMRRAGYESDQRNLMILDLATGIARNVTRDWDRSIIEASFAKDGDAIYVTAQDKGTTRIFRVDVENEAVTALTSGFADSSLRSTDQRLLFVRESFKQPPDLYLLSDTTERTLRTKPQRLTDVNSALLASRTMAEYEQFSFAGAEGDTVYGYVFFPVGYEKELRYPLAFIIHGGPQSSFGEGWSDRWNPQTLAAKGYAVVAIDFHGSTGYGQQFVDSINRDWAGKPLQDLQKGLAAAAERYPWIDADTACALGVSYGGYLVNWIAGHWPGGFRCLINHDGMFDLRSFYYTTEELWYPEWDFGGAYYEAPEAYERWNPANYVANWRTPMLVIHGLNDFRIPATQGLATFTALQRREVPSQLLIFPDENHWVVNPANSIQWHYAMHDWLARFLRAGARRHGANRR